MAEEAAALVVESIKKFENHLASRRFILILIL
jgi:hypothetical protein